MTVSPVNAQVEYVRADRPSDENAARHNRDVGHSYTMQPRIFAPIEMAPKIAGAASFRWNVHSNCLKKE